MLGRWLLKAGKYAAAITAIFGMVIAFVKAYEEYAPRLPRTPPVSSGKQAPVPPPALPEPGGPAEEPVTELRQSLNGVSVTYYHRDRDEGLVARILMREHVPYSTRHWDVEQNRFKTNALVAGVGTPLETVKLLARTLTRGGVRLQRIPKDSTFRNPKQILILTIINVENTPPTPLADPVFTLQEIDALRDPTEYRR